MDFLAKKSFTHLENYSNRNMNLVFLKRKLEELIGVKEENESMKSIELLQPRKKLKRSIEIWFRNVDRMTREINDLEKEVKGSNVLSSVGEKVLERIQEVEGLLQQSKSFDCLVTDDPQWIGQVLSTTTLFGEVPKKLMEEIWECLMDDKVSKIGVWGMGGVGKTTIMKLIHNQLLKDNIKFSKVIWITVSREISVTKFQYDIARAINVSLFEEEEDEITRAGKLHELLAKLVAQGKSYLLILDDLWHNLSLEEIGILEPSNESKLVITTRSLDVCRSLNCREVIIPKLSQPDAWKLFLEKVGQDILNYPDLLSLVKSVADECDGLPLAIVVMAGGMRRVRDIFMWRNALRELKEQVKSVNGMEEKIFQQLQFSYDRLRDENVKRCFLCCALYPEDFEIDADELIDLWIAEGCVEEMDSIQADKDRGHAILNELKNSCLTESGNKHLGRVKLHDIVRDMALRITSTSPQFFVKAGLQSKVLDIKGWKKGLEKVSLMHNQGLLIPSQMPSLNCPNLTTILMSNCGIKSIPEYLFEQMPRMKILDLSQNHMVSLPNSISNLESLTTLLLKGCLLLTEIPSLSKLQALKKLDLSDTAMKQLPHGMDELINLRYFNWIGTRTKKMATGILGNLTSLRQLKLISYSRVGMDLENGVELELGRKRKLEFLEVQFNRLEEFNGFAQALEGKWPHYYKILVGFYAGALGKTKNISIGRVPIINLCKIKLPSDVEELYFWRSFGGRKEVILSNSVTSCGNTNFSSLKTIEFVFIKNIKKLFSLDWVLCNLRNLEVLRVRGSYHGLETEFELKEIIDSESELDKETRKGCSFPRLKILALQDLPELERICSEKVSMVCDSIEEMEIYDCPKLKRLPLLFPIGNEGLPSPPPIKNIYAHSKEWWESTEWDQPQAKYMVEQFVKYYR